MILKALYDYYNRCGDLPAKGLEEKEIGFLIVLSPEGQFLRFEDCRTDKKHAKVFLVKKHIGRSSTAIANYLYDNSAYVLGYSEKGNDNEQLYFDTFKEKVESIAEAFPNSKEISAVKAFYNNGRENILQIISNDPLWEDIKKNLSKKYSIFSFRIEGDLQIVAEKKELLQLEENDNAEIGSICLITGKYGQIVDTTTATMIQGSQATAKLVSFQVKSGYDSYGKAKCGNAPISEEAEFAYTTALNSMLRYDSQNKFILGERTFVFWASSKNEASIKAEKSLFAMFNNYDADTEDNPNDKILRVKEVFKAIYSGSLKTSLDDKFYILGLAPNSARIAVVYWSETTLKDFAEKILRHFNDMEIHDTRPNKKPYMGVWEILSAVALEGKVSNVTPNLPEAVIKSIFQGLPYPESLFQACIHRIRAEVSLEKKGKKINPVNILRAAIIKAYLNRQNNNDKKIEIMLDTENTNQGYLCGRLFAVLDKIQEDANNNSSIRERYMNAASATPASVFATIMNLSIHHSEKLNEGSRIFYEKLKQEILDKMPADGFPAHLDLQDQGRFFVGYYHQRQSLFTSKKEQE